MSVFNGILFISIILIIVGGAVGALGEGFGIAPETVDEWLIYPFVIYAIDVCAKIVWRRMLKRVYDRIKSYFV